MLLAGTTGCYAAKIRRLDETRKKKEKNLMKYKEYEVAFSPARLNRYKNACGGITDTFGEGMMKYRNRERNGFAL